MGVADRIAQLLADPDPGLDRILAAIASLQQPGSAAQGTESMEAAVCSTLDRLAEQCPSSANPSDGGGRYPAELFAQVYGPLGFTGDLADYYDPANSLIDHVLERRRGIPLSLAAVVSEIARRHGHDLRPVGLPGHVLLGEGGKPTRWFDPFNRGVALSQDDCRSLFGRIHPIESFEPEMLRPMTGIEVAIRTLNNLRIAYAKRGDIGLMATVLALRVELSPRQPGDRAELADLLAGLGRFDQAAEQYKLLMAEDPDNAETHRANYRACRIRLN